MTTHFTFGKEFEWRLLPPKGEKSTSSQKQQTIEVLKKRQ